MTEELGDIRRAILIGDNTGLPPTERRLHYLRAIALAQEAKVQMLAEGIKE